MTSISSTDDTIDVRDIIARVEYLADDLSDALPGEDNEADHAELATLHALLDDLKGNGGDEQWQGDWYPITLIRDSYFKAYAQELADDIGAIDSNAGWPMSCIDWDQAAHELQQDYSSVEFEGVTYWYR